jgi:hypothetical protein
MAALFRLTFPWRMLPASEFYDREGLFANAIREIRDIQSYGLHHGA